MVQCPYSITIELSVTQNISFHFCQRSRRLEAETAFSVLFCVNFRQRRRETGRVYRASARPVFEDKPPSYNNATGNTAANRYLNRGREFLAKVTISPRQNTDEKA